MSVQFQHRRGTTAAHAGFTGAVGEITVDTDKKVAVVHDGATAGGVPLAKEVHAHAASVITVAATGTLRDTDVQAALATLAGRVPKILSRVTTTPPVSPAVGDSYIVPSGATGAWSGQTDKIAVCSAVTPTWIFITPAAGQYVVNDEDQGLWRYSGAAWVAAGLTIYQRGEISPAQLTANTNDWAPTGNGTASIIRFSTDAARNLTGLAGGAAGIVKRLANVGANTLVLKNADAGSSAGNRFAFGADITLKPGEAAYLWYDTTQTRWIMLGRSFVVITELPADIALPGDIAPAQITGNQNDYNPTGLAAASCLLLNADAARDVTGLQGGRRGRLLTIFNTAAFAITFKNESASSSAANRFQFGADLVLSQYQSLTLRYDSTASRWQVIASTAGAAVADGAVSPAKLSSDDAGLRAKIAGAPISAMTERLLSLNPAGVLSQENINATLTGIGSSGGVAPYIFDQRYIRARGTLRVSASRASSTSPAGFRSYVRVTVTTAQVSLGAADYLYVAEPIEAFRCYGYSFGTANAAQISVLWALRCSATGTIGAFLANHVTDRSQPKTAAISAANTWELKSFLFDGDQGGTWNSDGISIGMKAGVTLASGTDGNGTADTWASANNITTSAQTNLAATGSLTFDAIGPFVAIGRDLYDQVQNGKLTLATLPYLQRPVPELLPLCQRYYEKSYDLETAPATNTFAGIQSVPFNTAFGTHGFAFNTRKRIAPAMSGWASDGTANQWKRWSDVTLQTVSFANISERGVRFVTIAGATDAIEGHWAADARMVG